MSFNPSKRSPPQPQNSDCVQYYAAGHLARENAGVMSIKLSVTYVAFNSAGSEMLVNVGGEQIYLFDVNNNRHINELMIPQYLPKRPQLSYKSCCQPNGLCDANGISGDLFERSDDCACFYMKRALKSYQRKWMSDLYGAARDYLHVIQYWPDHKQAYIGLIKCLIALKWKEEAGTWLKYFVKVYPEVENTAQVKLLVEELQGVKVMGVKMEEVWPKKVDEDEKKIRLDSYDFEKRYLGHCNTTTDIKEANFLGLILSGGEGVTLVVCCRGR